MESRRTRARPKRFEGSPAAISSTNKRSNQASESARPRSPARRSSRPRSAASVNTVTISSDPSPIVIEEETEEVVISSSKSSGNLPQTLTTNTGSLATSKKFITSSVFSSNSTTTQKVVETRTSTTVIEPDGSDSKLRQRSLSKDIADTLTNRDRSHTPSTNSEVGGSRYSRSVSRSIYEDDDNISRGGFSEHGAIPEAEEELDENEHYVSFKTNPSGRTTLSYTRLQNIPKEFGGWLGALLIMIIAPISVYYLQWSCQKRICDFRQPNLKPLLDFQYLTRTVFKSEIVGAYVAFFFGIILLSTMPIGRHVRLYGERVGERVYNALPMAVLLSIGFGVGEYLKYPVANFVLTNYLRFCLYGLITAFVLAFWCYLSPLYNTNQTRNSGVQINEKGNTGNFLIDFALGRQINPKWLGFIDIKQALCRMSLMITFLLALCSMYRTINIPTWPKDQENMEALGVVQYYLANTTFNQATILSSSLLLLYSIEAILFEHHLASSFELQAEGLGLLLLLRYAATPFLLGAPVKYFADRRLNIMNNYVLIATITLFSIGFIIKLFSNAMKYKYRLDPLNSIFAYTPSIHTFQGKRLLLGPFWGRLRQPNYAGEILMLWAFGVPLISHKAFVPLIGLLLLIIQLLHRAVRVDTHNAARYHSSWVRYTSMVRYKIIPKVF